MADPVEQPPAGVGLFRILGQVALGLVLGFALLPALLELAAMANDVSVFKYQGF